MLAEDSVELREAAKATAQGGFRDGDLGADEQGLHIADAGHLNIVGHREAGYIFKLMGKIAAAHIKLLPQQSTFSIR